jgi:hypothetical protein
MPTTAGTYRLEVFPFEGSPNDGRGGGFTVDLSHGPVGGGTTPPSPPETGSLTGKVTDASTQEAIIGANVSLGTMNTTTGTNGTYAFTDLEPNTYTVTASADGYVSATATVEVTAGEPTIRDLQLTPETTAPTTGGLEGTVTSTAGVPIIGANVSLGTMNTTTGTNGSYAFTDLEPNTYTVTASADGYQTATGSVAVEAGKTAVLALELSPDPPDEEIALTAVGYKLRGFQKTDLAWTGASSVDVFRNGSEIASNVSGSAWTDNIDARGGGSYTYKVCKSGTTTCSNEVVVTF